MATIGAAYKLTTGHVAWVDYHTGGRNGYLVRILGSPAAKLAGVVCVSSGMYEYCEYRVQALSAAKSVAVKPAVVVAPVAPVVLVQDESKTEEWKLSANIGSIGFSKDATKYLVAFLNSSTGGVLRMALRFRKGSFACWRRKRRRISIV